MLKKGKNSSYVFVLWHSTFSTLVKPVKNSWLKIMKFEMENITRTLEWKQVSDSHKRPTNYNADVFMWMCIFMQDK